MATDNILSVGATGRDHATVALWEAATDNDLTDTDNDVREIGETYDDSTFTGANTISGAITSAENHRILRAATGQSYDPKTGAGSYHTHNAVGVPLGSSEQYFQLIGQGVEHLDVSSASTRLCINMSGTAGQVVDSCFATIGSGGSGTRTRITAGSGSGQSFRNCIVTGVGSTAAANYGIQNTRSSGTVYNCVAYGIANGGVGSGFNMTVESSDNIAIGSGASDFVSSSGQSYNISGDSTAAGDGSLTNQGANNVFANAAGNDFRLRFESAAAGSGVDLRSSFSTEFDGNSRTGPWDRGAYKYDNPSTGHLRPVADVIATDAAGTWVDFPARTDQFNAELVDEPDNTEDGDQSDGVLGVNVSAGDTWAVQLDPGTNPGDNKHHSVQYNAILQNGEPVSVRGSLYQGDPFAGGTLIAEQNEDVIVDTTGFRSEFHLSRTQARSISDYTQLYFRIRVVSVSTDAANLLLYYVHFQYPGEKAYQSGIPAADSNAVGFATIVGDTEDTDGRRFAVLKETDEQSDEDTSYVAEPDVSVGDQFTVQLAAIDPQDSSLHVVEVFEKKQQGNKTCDRVVELWQYEPDSVTDAYLITTIEEKLNSTNWKQVKKFLSDAEAALIVDYNELYLRYKIVGCSGGTTDDVTEVRVSKGQLRTLSPPPVPGTPLAGFLWR